jgi:hypothetical protein
MLLYLRSAEAYVEVSLRVFLVVLACKAKIKMTQSVQGPLIVLTENTDPTAVVLYVTRVRQIVAIRSICRIPPLVTKVYAPRICYVWTSPV